MKSNVTAEESSDTDKRGDWSGLKGVEEEGTPTVTPPPTINNQRIDGSCPESCPITNSI